MSLHDHSSITITIEVTDFDCLHRQFQTSLSHLLCRAPPSAGCAASCYGCRPSCHNRMLAAERQEATLLCPLRVQPRAGPPQATSSGWFSELLLGAPLSCHYSESAVDALRCLPPARHLRRGLEIHPDLHSYSSSFYSLAALAYKMTYSMLQYHTFLWFIAGVLYHTCAI